MSKQELMDEIISEVQVCRKCRLWQYARNPVPGEGSLEASLMLIGEAPGYREDLEGGPFVGSAGKLLDKLISGITLRREEVYISNIVKHRSAKNREPKADEVEACTAYLDRQIQIIRPKIIATLGKHSTRYILSKVNIQVDGLTAVRGRAYKENILGLPVTIIPTFHPAAVLYNPAYRSGLEEDFQKIREELEKKV